MPWLLVLDGLERVLVAYHRFDAAQAADEQLDTAKDQITHRDPCSAIRPEDDDLLRVLSAASPSKLIITTRLTPRVLLNSASQPLPGVLRVPLPGLRPADAEALLRACGVTGTSQEIQNYLKSHCDCHPLVTGVLAGLINDYLPARGNFDAWADDLAGGGQLNLANLDLVQKRNHILHAALNALPEKSRQLLSLLSVLSQAVNYPALLALNPHLPSKHEEVQEPEKQEEDWRWRMMTDEEKEPTRQEYQTTLQRREEYKQAFQSRLQAPEFLAAQQELIMIIQDLERRGLLQYDAQTKRYELHPIVRGITAGSLRQKEKEYYGQRVVDYFSRQAHRPYLEAETLEDLRNGIQIVRTLLVMGRYQEASCALNTDLHNALVYHLEAYAEALSILRPFFRQGWTSFPEDVNETDAVVLVDHAAYLLAESGELTEALAVYGVLLSTMLKQENWTVVGNTLSNIARTLSDQDRLVKEESCCRFALNIATLNNYEEGVFIARQGLFQHLAAIGRREDAEAMWQLLDSMGRDWSARSYRPGNAEYDYCRFRFWQGDLREEYLARAEHLATTGKNRRTIRRLHRLRGEWQLTRGHWALAADSLQEAVRRAREVGQKDAQAEAMLVLVMFYLNRLPEPRCEAEQLAKADIPAHHVLADLWSALSDDEQAKKHALAAYKWAWADGEPYVFRYELNKARAQLKMLGAQTPELPPYDPARDEKLPWEDELTAAIEQLSA